MNVTVIALVCCCLSGMPGPRGGSGAARIAAPGSVRPALGEEYLYRRPVVNTAAGWAENMQLGLREEYRHPKAVVNAAIVAGWAEDMLPVFAGGKKSAAPIIKVIFVEESRPEEPASDTLFYHQRHIRPGDFLGTSSSSGRSEAVSYTSFAFDGSTRRYHDTLEIRLVLQVFWVKSASWARTMPPNRHTLEHEQLHFDITRLVAERFRQKVLSMPLTFDDHDSRIQYEYLEAFREMNRMQDDFDNAVNRGMDAAGQREWLHRVRGELHGFGVVTPEM